MPFGAWLEYWYKYHCEPLIRPSTRTHYEVTIRKHIIPSLGHIPLKEITPECLQQFYKDKKSDGRLIRREHFGAELADSSIRRFHCICRKSGTGCISELNDHLYEGKFSITWIDGKKRTVTTYATTREECEEQLAEVIKETKEELDNLKKALPPKPPKRVKILYY